jgi:F-type H+-transporting ATPase subunit epsilon
VAQTFTCSVVTPEKAVFDAAVVYANLPAYNGQLGVMHNRAPMLTQLGSGVLSLELPDGKRKRFQLTGGFAQMNANKLTLLSEKAVDLDPGAAAEA